MKNDCPHNDAIMCPPNERHCATCGWNSEGTKTKNPQRGPTKSKRVAKVDASGQVVEIYSTIGMAAAVNHVSRATVRNRCEDTPTRFTVKLGGYTFRYID